MSDIPATTEVRVAMIAAAVHAADRATQKQINSPAGLREDYITYWLDKYQKAYDGIRDAVYPRTDPE